MNKKIIALILASLAARPLAAASVLIYGRGEDSRKLDPADVTDGESVKVIVNIFETLVTYADDSPELVAGLARKWDRSKDGRRWLFQLRPNVKFHDGSPLNAEAVVFSFQRLLDSKNPFRFGGAFGYAGSYRMILSVKAAGPLAVEFRLKAPTAVFLPNLAMFPASIISPRAMKRFGKDFFRHPVGTGPFLFRKWAPHQKIVLDANRNYWGGPPTIDRLIFKPVRENAARALQLESGAIQMMDGIDFADIARLKKQTNVVVETAPGMNMAYLAMNCDLKPFQDSRVRRAIAFAIDKPKILKLAYHGYGTPAVNPLPPTIWGYNANIVDRTRDLSKARMLLAEAGFPNGFQTQLWAMPNPRPYMPQPRQVAQIIKEDLKAIGIQATIISYDWNQYLARTASGEHPMCLLGWSTDNADPDNFLYELLDKDKAVRGSANNICFYRSEEVHQSLFAAQRELDQPRRAELYKKAQAIIFRDAPMVPLAYLPLVTAHSRHVKGYHLHPTGMVRLGRVRIE